MGPFRCDSSVASVERRRIPSHLCVSRVLGVLTARPNPDFTPSCPASDNPYEAEVAAYALNMRASLT